MTIESLARTIAKARHGTDAHWANYVPSALAVLATFADVLENLSIEPYFLADDIRALLALSDGAQEGFRGINPTRFHYNEADDY